MHVYVHDAMHEGARRCGNPRCNARTVDVMHDAMDDVAPLLLEGDCNLGKPVHQVRVGLL